MCSVGVGRERGERGEGGRREREREREGEGGGWSHHVTLIQVVSYLSYTLSKYRPHTEFVPRKHSYRQGGSAGRENFAYVIIN